MNGIWDVIKIIIPGAIAYTMPILMGALGASMWKEWSRIRSARL